MYTENTTPYKNYNFIAKSDFDYQNKSEYRTIMLFDPEYNKCIIIYADSLKNEIESIKNLVNDFKKALYKYYDFLPMVAYLEAIAKSYNLKYSINL